MDGPGIVVTRHESASAAWQMASRPPHPCLRGHVVSYSGYREDAAVRVRRREAPSGQVVLILGFGAPLRVLPPPDRLASVGAYGSFLAGLGDRPTITEHAGGQRGIQVDLTPLGAYALLGMPMSEVTNAVVHLTDLFGPEADLLVERLAAAPGWAARFTLLDEVLASRIEAGPVPSPEVVRAWHRLQQTAGAVGVAELASEVGWSRRHLVTRFREQIGLAPKVAARVLRFERAVRLLTRPDTPPWAELALACGYYDQAHLNREFQALAGCTPTALLSGDCPIAADDPPAALAAPA